MLNADLFADNESLFSATSSSGDADSIGDYMTRKGLLLTLVFIFIGGLALNLTHMRLSADPYHRVIFWRSGRIWQGKVSSQRRAVPAGHGGHVFCPGCGGGTYWRSVWRTIATLGDDPCLLRLC